MPRSFGTLHKSTLNSTSAGHTSVQSNITIPEGPYFTSRQAATADYDRTIHDSQLMDDYFGFDDDDDTDNNNDTLLEQSKSMSKPKCEALNEIRAGLKRFLHNPDAADATLKKSKTADKVSKKRAIKTPVKNPTKKEKQTPVKRNVVFGDTDAKQKDIRNAFTAKAQQNEKHAKSAPTTDDTIVLFEEVVPVIRLIKSKFISFSLATFDLIQKKKISESRSPTQL